MRCPECGHENPDDEAYCNACGASPNVGLLDHPEDPDDKYYTYEWFGVRHTYAKWRWRLGLVVLGGWMFILAVVFASFGWYVNAIILATVGVIGILIYRWIGEAKASVGALFLAGITIASGIYAGFMPWEMWAEESHERYMAPRLLDDISYHVEGAAHIVVSGTVTNSGRTGCTAVVHFNAFGGWSENTSDMFNSFAEGTVVTGWLAPGGGSDTVNWECTLSHFNAMGDVSWTVEPSGS